MRLYDVRDSVERKKKRCIKTFKVNATTMPIFLLFFFVMQANENFKQKRNYKTFKKKYFFLKK